MNLIDNLFVGKVFIINGEPDIRFSVKGSKVWSSCCEQAFKDFEKSLVLAKEEERILDNGDRAYYKLYTNGLCQFGIYDTEGKWWSSSESAMHKIFGLNLHHIAINNIGYYSCLSNVYHELMCAKHDEIIAMMPKVNYA